MKSLVCRKQHINILPTLAFNNKCITQCTVGTIMCFHFPLYFFFFFVLFFFFVFFFGGGGVGGGGSFEKLLHIFVHFVKTNCMAAKHFTYILYNILNMIRE